MKNLIHQNSNFTLFSIYEDIYLVDRKDNSETFLFSVYGDPICGLIDSSNQWITIGGNILHIWNISSSKMETIDLLWIYDLRQIDKDTIEVLTDPWSKESAIWQINILTNRKMKIKDFTDFHGKEYVDERIEW